MKWREIKLTQSLFSVSRTLWLWAQWVPCEMRVTRPMSEVSGCTLMVAARPSTGSWNPPYPAVGTTPPIICGVSVTRAVGVGWVPHSWTQLLIWNFKNLLGLNFCGYPLLMNLNFRERAVLRFYLLICFQSQVFICTMTMTIFSNQWIYNQIMKHSHYSLHCTYYTRTF